MSEDTKRERPYTYGAARDLDNLAETFEAYLNASGTFGFSEVEGLNFLEWSKKLHRIAEFVAQLEKRP